MARRAEHDRNESVQAALKRSGYRLRSRNDGSEKLIVPVKPIAISLPVSQNVNIPEPELSLEDYDKVLAMIQSMAMVFERSPSVYKIMGEEALRNILLVALNGLFKGEATGETFNGNGKTDILIRSRDCNLFIAECLIWDGPQHFKKKLTEQLFSYSTWRDSKLAAIIFNRKKDFTTVVEKMKEVVSELDEIVSEMTCSFKSGCRYKLHRSDDKQKQ